VSNLSITIRNFFIAVPQAAALEALMAREAAALETAAAQAAAAAAEALRSQAAEARQQYAACYVAHPELLSVG
jgi:hypothetical protein